MSNLLGIEIAEAFRAASLRCTPQRYAVLEYLASSTRHATAEEIFEAVNRTDPRSSRATVYNSLNALVRAGLVRLSEDVHALSYRLHPSILEDLGLAEALKAEIDRFRQQHPMEVKLNLSDLPDRIPGDPALCLFRVAQEALRNLGRHSGASCAEVSLRTVDKGLHLAVQDNGRGFDPASERRSPSLGLSSMNERVLLLGGEFEIESAPGQGTTVLAWVPLKEINN